MTNSRLGSNLRRPGLAVVAIAASVIAFGSAGASVAANLIGSDDIKNDSIQSKDIKNYTIKGKDIHKGAIKTGKIKDGAVESRDVRDKSLEVVDLSDAAVNSLRGARGPAGPQGPAGQQGPAGPQGAPAANEFGVATVFVSRTGAAPASPARWATYSVPLGSPTGSTTGGQFRFSCSAAQAPCKVSIGAAVISTTSTEDAAFYPRLLIHKEDGPGDPMTNCEYADGANNNLGVDTIARVPTLADAVTAMQTPLTMGVGGTLDCGSTQPATPTVTEIWVPAASNGNSTAFYDVWATFGFGGIATQPLGNG